MRFCLILSADIFSYAVKSMILSRKESIFDIMNELF